VNLEISGTITFHVKLTTDEALQKAEDLSAASAAADIFVSGDSFGAEEVQAGTAYQYTVMVEQPSVLLRVSRNQYMESIAPLQEMERLRKLDFLAPIMPFSEMPKEKVTEISDWFQIARYRAGENITDEGIVSDKIIFLLSGEAEVIKRVWNDEVHQKQAYKDIQNRALTSQLSEDSPSAAFMSIYGATRDPLEGVRTSSLGWITPGMTINLEETLTKHPNTYTATADTPVEVLVSGGGSLITLSGDWHAPSWDHDFQPKASSEEEGAAAAAAGGSEAAHGGAGVGGVAGAEEDSGATRVSSLEATTSKLGKLILGHQDFEPLLERAPAFPHLENLANQFSERRVSREHTCPTS
jgi:CRP-like cAMP-binding protein